MHPIFIPWCAGDSRHGRLVRTHAPDSDPGWIPAPAGDTNHRRPNNGSPGSQERNVGLGLVPSQGAGRGHRRHLNPSIDLCTQFSYLGVPATAGMGDWYENTWHQSSRIFTGQHLASCDRLIRSSTICYPCARSVPAISLSPWERAGVRVKAGIGARGNNDAQTRPLTSARNFHTLVCRHPPASAIGRNLFKRSGSGFRMGIGPLWMN